MSKKLNFIPKINSYDWFRKQMSEDLKYRLLERKELTDFGIPLYYNINVQLIMTQECPYSCPFCLERQNPMEGDNNFEKQITSLRKIIDQHPTARLTITGGEPTLYPDQIKKIVEVFNKGDRKFISLNTAGYDCSIINIVDNINLSVNDYIHPDISKFPNATYQTVLEDFNMKWENISNIMRYTNMNKFSFRFLSSFTKHDYPVEIWNDIQKNANVRTFRVGDFFAYATFDYNGKHARLTLGDMYQQKNNKYKESYSNLIIHPSGEIGKNWT